MYVLLQKQHFIFVFFGIDWICYLLQHRSHSYNELFCGKASIYALVDNGTRWKKKRARGELKLCRNKQSPNDVQIGWFKNNKQLWWRLSPGKNAKLCSNGARAWIVKANVCHFNYLFGSFIFIPFYMFVLKIRVLTTCTNHKIEWKIVFV